MFWVPFFNFRLNNAKNSCLSSQNQCKDRRTECPFPPRCGSACENWPPLCNFDGLILCLEFNQKLSSKTVIKSWHQKLPSKIAIESCHRKLSSKIVLNVLKVTSLWIRNSCYVLKKVPKSKFCIGPLNLLKSSLSSFQLKSFLTSRPKDKIPSHCC